MTSDGTLEGDLEGVAQVSFPQPQVTVPVHTLVPLVFKIEDLLCQLQ